MTARREFSNKVKLAAFDRSGGRCEFIRPNGERCGLLLMPGKFRYDHIIPDAMGGEPTLKNCQAICAACDSPKTALDQTSIAKVKRIRAKHVGARKRSTFPHSKDSPTKRKVSGEVVRR